MLGNFHENLWHLKYRIIISYVSLGIFPVYYLLKSTLEEKKKSLPRIYTLNTISIFISNFVK